MWDWATRKELLKWKGHSAPILCVAWSPGGVYLASASADQTVKIWDSATGQELKSLEGHTDAVQSVAWSPDGARLGSASKDGTARIWDIGTGKEIRTLRGWGAIAWSPDGRRLATQALKGSTRLRIWDASSGQQVLGVRNPRTGAIAWGSVAWSPDGHRLAADGPNSSIQVWDASSGKEVSFLLGHKYSPVVAWHPGGRRIASTTFDGTVRVWTMDSGYEVLILPGKGALAWSPDGRRLASSAAGRKIKIWDASRGYAIAGRPEEYERDRGYRLLEASEFDEAISVFAKLMKTSAANPGHPRALAGAYFERGAVAHGHGKIDEALRDFDEAIRLYPEYLQALNLRARVYLEMEAFAEAVPDLLKKFEIEYGTEKAVTGHRLGLSCLATGDTDGYRSASARMLELFASAKDPEEGRRLAWACALAPGAASDLSAAVSAAERAVQSDPASVECLNALGAILYRTGEFEEAIERLTQARRLEQQADSSARPSRLCTPYFLAMAHHRLEHNEKAEEFYQDAVGSTERAVGEDEGEKTTLSWGERLTLQLLRQEAEALLHGR